MTLQSRITLLGALAVALIGQASLAQPVYKIVGPDGKVTFSDKPPPSADKGKVTTPGAAAAGGSGNGNADLPYELRQVANKYPVTLYTAASCAPCDAARALLKGRGVPFAERTVSTPEDTEALRRLIGDSSVPHLTIGSQKLKGFSDTEWTQYLTVAGYPTTSSLPKNYRLPSPSPLVAAQKATTAPTKEASVVAEPDAPPPPPSSPSPSNPAGITF